MTGTRSMEGKAVPVAELQVEITTPATIRWCQAQLELKCMMEIALWPPDCLLDFAGRHPFPGCLQV